MIASRTLPMALMLVVLAARAESPQIDVYPGASLFDQVAPIGIEHVPPGKTVTLRQHTDLWSGAWESEASFVADAKGEVDVTEQAPISGSYGGVEPMGLFWSAHYIKGGTKPLTITDTFVSELTLSVDDKDVATAKMKRRWAAGGVRARDVREDGLVGLLAEASGSARHPGILLLGGGEGGYQEVEATLLASRGFTVLSLAYFGVRGVPSSLVKVPLEYLKGGIDWLRKLDSVDPEKIAVVGASRGAELALLLGSTFPEIKAVVALAPSHVAWSGIGFPYRVASWTLHGEPVPFAQSYPSAGEIIKLLLGGRTQLRDAFERGLRESSRVAAATIAVEKINGPVLLISGKDDGVWPSEEMGQQVMQRLRDNHHAFHDEQLSYEGAGHALPHYYGPLLGNDAWAGGTAAADVHAFRDYRPKMHAFLDRALGRIDVTAELEAMFDSDQSLRLQIHELEIKGPNSKKAAALMKKQDPIDQANLKRLDEIVTAGGWPMISVVGGKAAYGAWVVVQHADLAAQEKYLPAVRAAVAEDEAMPDQLALLEDRIRVGKGEKQIYGSQVRGDGKGGWSLDPIEDEAHVDERRKAIGLEPLADYAKTFGIEYKPKN